MLNLSKKKEKDKYDKFKEVNSLLNQRSRDDFYKAKEILKEIRDEIEDEIKIIKKENNLNSLLKLKEKLNEAINRRSKTEVKIIVNKIDLYRKNEDYEFDVKNLNFPINLRDEMIDDLNEIERCYKNQCYKASIIICARVLETTLHRLYYEKTGNDLLEKAPGIGLGKLIAKLKKKNELLDPAITQQIHVINQTRIYSVHKKKQLFNPSRGQTKAIILYTKEIIKNVFG
ncbi:MAG: hypothetical protein ACOCP4_01195 [Candidatus Woesearchaeota archaeon]